MPSFGLSEAVFPIDVAILQEKGAPHFIVRTVTVLKLPYYKSRGFRTLCSSSHDRHASVIIAVTEESLE